MISVLLAYKILQLFVYMILGFLLVKLKVIKSDDSMVLSKIALWLLMPAAIINSFDVEVTNELLSGILLAFCAAIIMHLLLIVIDFAFSRIFKGNCVERASVMYSNAANLIIPIVSFALGDEWVIYSCAFMSVQLVFMWTHGVQLFTETKEVDLKKILLNVNIIAILAGFCLMIFGLRLPPFVKDISSSLSAMVGVVGMLIAGMLAAKIDFKQVVKNKRLYLVLVMRMIVCPVIMLVLLKTALLLVDIKDADKVLLIVYLASITPSAATLMQFAQIYNKDSVFATAVNIFTTIICIATIPAFVWLYWL